MPNADDWQYRIITDEMAKRGMDVKDFLGDTGALRESELKMMMPERKRMSEADIRNYGMLYGKPLSQQQIDYFENQMNRNPDSSYYGDFPEFPKG